MKKKIIFAVATSFFAVATMFNMNVLQDSNAGDVSLESITIMQKAEAEDSNRRCVRWGGDNKCYWTTSSSNYPSCNTCKG